MVFLGLLELLHVEVKRGDPFQTGHFLFAGWIHVQHFLELIDGTPRDIIILLVIRSWNVLIRQGSGQVEPGVYQRGIEFHSLLEVPNGLFVVGILVRLNPLVKLVTRPKLAAACRREQHQADHHQGQHSYAVFHCVYKSPFPGIWDVTTPVKIAQILERTDAQTTSPGRLMFPAFSYASQARTVASALA